MKSEKHDLSKVKKWCAYMGEEMIGSEAMGRITCQVLAGSKPAANETVEEREFREETEQWLVRMRRDAEQRGLNLEVEIPSEW